VGRFATSWTLIQLRLAKSTTARAKANQHRLQVTKPPLAVQANPLDACLLLHHLVPYGTPPKPPKTDGLRDRGCSSTHDPLAGLEREIYSILAVPVTDLRLPVSPWMLLILTGPLTVPRIAAVGVSGAFVGLA
jgi:hypothetical protein